MLIPSVDVYPRTVLLGHNMILHQIFYFYFFFLITKELSGCTQYRMKELSGCFLKEKSKVAIFNALYIGTIKSKFISKEEIKMGYKKNLEK